jgi:hypothetical protein
MKEVQAEMSAEYRIAVTRKMPLSKLTMQMARNVQWRS